ncbi:MAG TPA: fibronectin type III domain-containing protein [Niastella sp.]
MKKQIIIFGNQRELVTLCQRVREKMKSNPVFPNPPAALAELEKVLPEYEVALANARSRDKEWVAIKNNKKARILALLEELSEYVIATCKGDRALILSSGFDVTDEQISRITTVIETLQVVLGEPGEATVHIKKAAGALVYVYEYATEPPGANTVWVREESTIRDHTFRGLQSDKRYWFRVIAIGRRNQKAYSPVVSRSIQ